MSNDASTKSWAADMDRRFGFDREGRAADVTMSPEEQRKRRLEQEKIKAQRMLIRSLRAGGGGIFESDVRSNLGGAQESL